METTVLTCTAREGMYDTKDAGRNVRSEVHTLMGRIRSILGYRKDTMAHLTKQFTLFQTVTNRGTRSHSHTNHQQYVKASVDDFLTITFLLRAESEFQVSLASLHTLEYIKGDSKLICNFDILHAKINTSARHVGYMYTDVSYTKNFLKTDDYVQLDSEAQVRAEIEDLLFDYTNIEELMDEQSRIEASTVETV